MRILDKLNNNERLSQEDGLELYELELSDLKYYANRIREEKHAKKTYFNINRHINPTNICKDVCQFCAYSASRKNPKPYTMSHDAILNIMEESSKNNITEVHIVSAHNPNVSLNWYLDTFKKIKKNYPHIHIKALTAAEVHFLAKEYNMSYRELIDKMIECGVDSMPGGGAEVFDEQLRKRICDGKVKSDQWIEIHKLWHESGRKSTCSILFGHIESREHRIDHMLRLRNLQDETGGFTAFVPLQYQLENNYLKVEGILSEEEFLKTIAISRLMLDNIPHIKSYWVTSTARLALIAQEYGANDIDGTIEKESIQSIAGAKSANGKSLKELVNDILKSGFTPIERDSIYNEIKEYVEYR